MNEKVNRAETAHRTLNNDFIKGAIEAVRKSCYDDIKDSKPEDQDLREDQYYMLRAVDEFERVLKRYIEDGKVIKNQIKQIMR